MKSFRIAAILALLAGPVHAQSIGISPEGSPKTPEQLEREQAIERNYKEGLKKIPDAKANNDPWANVRSAETPRAAAKAPAAKPAPAKNSQARSAAPQ